MSWTTFLTPFLTPFWHDWHDLLAMGGQGRFVWTSFGVTLAVLLLELGLQQSQRQRWQRARQRSDGGAP